MKLSAGMAKSIFGQPTSEIPAQTPASNTNSLKNIPPTKTPSTRFVFPLPSEAFKKRNTGINATSASSTPTSFAVEIHSTPAESETSSAATTAVPPKKLATRVLFVRLLLLLLFLVFLKLVQRSNQINEAARHTDKSAHNRQQWSGSNHPVDPPAEEEHPKDAPGYGESEAGICCGRPRP